MSAFREGNRVVVVVPQRMTRAQEHELVPGLVRQLLAREAKRRAPASDEALADRAVALASTYLDAAVGQPVRAASVRWVTNQRTRWGSCTPATGDVRVSDRVREMPDWVVDYVLLHELVHLVESGHTERFWRLVGAYPQAERARGFLDGVSHASREPQA